MCNEPCNSIGLLCRTHLVQQGSVGTERDALPEVRAHTDGDTVTHGTAVRLAMLPCHQQLDERLDVVVDRLCKDEHGEGC